MYKVKNIGYKYFLKNGKAFTEDHVLVRCIRVTYRLAPIYETLTYFQKFGDFEKFKLRIERKPYRCEEFYRIYIRFVEPEAAYRTLKIKEHIVNNQRLIVEPAYSWRQPDAEKLCNPKAENPEEHEIVHIPKVATNILHLPESCIEVIFEHMKPGDQIRFARTHKGFEYIFESFCRRKIKKINLEEMQKMTLWEIRDFLKITGKNLIEISGSLNHKYCDDIFELMSEHCTNLEIVTLKNMVVSEDCLRYFFMRMLPELRELKITNCPMSDVIINILTHSKKIRSLHLERVQNISGSYIPELLQLEHLSLRDCLQVKKHNVGIIFMSLKNLRSLDVCGIELELFPNFYHLMPMFCRKLEIMKLTSLHDDFRRVALSPCLKHLEVIYPRPNEMMTVLPELVQHKADQLEILKIYSRRCLTAEHIKTISQLRKLKILFIAFSGDALTNLGLAQLGELTLLENLTIAGSDSVTNEGLLNLLRACPKLHTLNLQFCKKITNDFLIEVIFMTRFLHRKFNIYAYGTSVVKAEIVHCPSYKYVLRRSLLDIEFNFTQIGLKEYF